MSDTLIQLPDAVSEVLSLLEKSKDSRHETLLKLTQPRANNKSGSFYEARHYEKMWSDIAKQEQKRGTDLNTSQWVLDFIDDVIDAQKLPKYYYIENENRLELITDLLSLKNEMVQIFSENQSCLNPRLREALNRKNLPSKEDRQKHSLYQNPAFNFIEALEFYTNHLIKDIASVDDLLNDNAGIEQRMFAIALIKRNQLLYQKDLLEVVTVTIWALFGVFKVMGALSLMKKRAKEI